METERLNIYLPRSVAQDLRRYVPARQRARFVAQAVARELNRLKVLAAIDASAGAWREEDHPELATPADIDRWIEERRAEWNRDRCPPGGESQNG
ncbi:MAG: hypothetical protein ACK4WK_02265 [Anaerolineae bacterium]